MAEAREVNHSYVGTEHLLLGLIREEKGIAAQVLTDAGVTLAKARGAMISVLGEERPAARSRAERGPTAARVLVDNRRAVCRVTRARARGDARWTERRDRARIGGLSANSRRDRAAPSRRWVRERSARSTSLRPRRAFGRIGERRQARCAASCARTRGDGRGRDDRVAGIRSRPDTGVCLPRRCTSCSRCSTHVPRSRRPSKLRASTRVASGRKQGG